MRLYPAVSSGTIRITHKPMQLGPYSLPAGQPVMIPFFAIHRSPRLWEDPDDFKPERWLAGEEGTPAAKAAAEGSSVAGKGEAPSGEAAAGNTPVGSDVAADQDEDDYVDVAADLSAMRDQGKQQQQQQQQQQQAGSKPNSVQPGAPAQQQEATAATSAAKLGGSGLEIKVSCCGSLWRTCVASHSCLSEDYKSAVSISSAAPNMRFSCLAPNFVVHATVVITPWRYSISSCRSACCFQSCFQAAAG
jgi:hypothetical protein